MVVAYQHEPFTDFSIEKNYNKMKEAIKKVEADLGGEYPLIIDGEYITTEEKIISVNPANPDEVIGRVSMANKNIAEQAIKAANRNFSWWRKSDPVMRADILFRAAAIVRRRKFEFSALLVKEGGKPWKEADGDIAEGIDFLEYYGREMIRLKDGAPVTSRPVERNEFCYIPLGVGVVISPWNFLFAIMAGTTSAAMVTGNTVLLKPASATPVIAYKFIKVLEEAGLPKGIVNYVPGPGQEVGDYLVDHPQTRFINFTGSREVGTRIFERSGVVHEDKGQIWLKRAIIEMGGKDTIIVDKQADLQLAAESIVQSAFGFSGQKCSACSRAVIHEAVYEDVKKRIMKLTTSLTVGDPAQSKNDIGPVIDQAAFDKIMSYIEIGHNEGKLIVGGEGDDSEGWFIKPTVFADVDPEARIMQEEIFGPVLAITSAKNFKEAIQIANNTEYGLTGSVISNNREHLEQAREDFHVGNLYFNRGCTAAIVGYHPFGGFNMSGTNSKAGGPDYLVQHMQGKSISEML